MIYNLIRFSAASILIAAVAISGCARDGAQVLPAGQAPSEGPATLPSPLSLPHSASGYSDIYGTNYLMQYGGYWDGTSLVLDLSGGGGMPPKGGSQSVSAVSRQVSGLPDIAYAIYMFTGIPDPVATLKVFSGPNYKAKLWLGLADWESGSWDFSKGDFFANPMIDVSSESPDITKYLREDGALAIAVVVDDSDEPVVIKKLELTVLSEVEELGVDSGRWDGIELTWSTTDERDGYRVYRRLADAGPLAPWSEMTGEPLGRWDGSWLDRIVEQGTQYEYKVSAGYRRSPLGVTQWFWSEGRSIIGWQQISELNLGMDEDDLYWPGLYDNKLTFLYQSADFPGQIGAVSAKNFAPDDQWVYYQPGATGFGSFALAQADGFEVPLLNRQANLVNNPAVTSFYSTDEGTYSQIGYYDDSEILMWHSPEPIRDAESFLVSTVLMPRRIGAITWNTVDLRLELVDSIDIYGRWWNEFQPQDFPWMVIGSFKPEGPVCDLNYVANPKLCFTEAVTREIKILNFDYAGWIDDSPGITAASGPEIHSALVPPLTPLLALFYLTEDQSEIRLVHQDIWGEWQTDDIEIIVSSPTGSPIEDFKVHTNGEFSYNSFMVYTVDGVLYMQHTDDVSLVEWDAPRLIDDAGSCSRVETILVGSDMEWNSYLFVTYTKVNEFGERVVAFRDLLVALEIS